MSDTLQLGGKKYELPKNMEERKELLRIMKELDVPSFRGFIFTHLQDLHHWTQFDDEKLTHILHMMRSQQVGLGDDFVSSRNFLRAKQFNYSGTEELPLCASCRWFRDVPPEEETSCMMMGSIPQDISCPAYEALPNH